jgi:hypothetical protein
MRWVLRRAPESVDTIPADLRRVRSGVAREARLLAEAMRSDGYRTEEMDPIAALLDLRAQRDAMQGALRANPNGRHTKGGLYGEESDYFGKDREDAEG